jgi:transposase
MPMTGSIDRVEVITWVQRRRRWLAEEKARIVHETYAPGMSVSLVARQGALSAMGAGEEVVPASEYRALQHQVRELQRLLGKKTLKNEILREALDLVRPKKRLLRSPSPARDGTPGRRFPMRSAWRAPICRARGAGSDPAAAGSSPTARGRACRRDQGADPQATDLQLAAHPCAAPASAPRRRRCAGQRQTRLPDHEGARSLPRPRYR